MKSPATLVFALLALGIFRLTKGDNDAFERVAPRVQARLNEVRKVLLPIPDDTLQEAVYHLGTYYIPLDAETELCKNHSSILFDSFLKYDTWALKMVDAASKLAPGVMDGRLVDLGSYDQCISISAPGDLFRGQHCVVETKGILPDMDIFNPEVQFLPTMRTDLGFSVCVPSTCTARDVETHMNVALNSVNASAIVTKYNCSSTLAEPFSLMDWVAILVLVAIAALLILSTAYDNSVCLESEKNPLLTAWSVSSNLPRMLSTHIPTAAISSLNGLRVLAMAWIMIGHRMLYMLSFPTIRFKTMTERIDEVALAPVENTQVAVEIFFLMSGTLVCYSYLRFRQKVKTFNLTHFYLFRYLRLTPSFAIMALLYATLFIRVSDGPLWRRSMGYLMEYCQRNWWANLLYIHNYVYPYELCITQTWYLSSDFQLYLFSPVLLIPLYKKPKLGLALTAGFFVLTTAGGLYNAYAEELKAGGAVTFDRRTEINQVKDYIVTHIRAASFLMGIAFGYLLFQIKQGHVVIKLSKLHLLAGWLVSIFLILFSVFFILWFQNPDYIYNPVVDIPYLVLHRHMLSLGVIWIVLVCTLGYGGFVDKFLSWPVFVPLARLTYCAYLTHVYVQNVQSSSQRNNTNISLLQLYYHFCADFFISYLTGAVLYLAVEAPCTNLTDYMFQGKRKKSEVEPKSEVGPETGVQLPVFKYAS